MLTYANDSLTYRLNDIIKTINWRWKAYSRLGMSSATENAKKYTDFAIYQLNVLSSEACG